MLVRHKCKFLIFGLLAAALGGLPTSSGQSTWSPPGLVHVANTPLSKGIAIPLPLPKIQAGLFRTLYLRADPQGRALWIGRPDGLYRWTPSDATLKQVISNREIVALETSASMLWAVAMPGSRDPGAGTLLLGIDFATSAIVVQKSLSTSQYSSRTWNVVAHESECCVLLTLLGNSLSESTLSFAYNKQKKRLDSLGYIVYHVFGSGRSAIVIKGPPLADALQSRRAGKQPETFAVCHSDLASDGALTDCRKTETFYESFPSDDDHTLSDVFVFDGNSIWELAQRRDTDSKRIISRLI